MNLFFFSFSKTSRPDFYRRWLTLFLFFFLLAFHFSSARANVTILNLTLSGGSGEVVVAWESGAELNVSGYYVTRSTSPDGGYTRLNQAIISPRGTALAGSVYSYSDRNVSVGTTYYYRLEVLNTDQTSQFFGPLSITPSASGTPSGPSATNTSPPTVGPTSTSPIASPSPLSFTPLPSTPVPTSGESPTAYPGFPIESPTVEVTPYSAPIDTPAIIPTRDPTLIALEQTATALSIVGTPLPTSTPGPLLSRLSSQDWIRVSLLVLIGSLWVLLGAWLYYYLSRLTR